MAYMIDKIKLDVRQARQKVTAMAAKRDLLIEQQDAEIMRSAEATRTLELNEKVQRLLQLTSEFARQQAKSRIEEIVTSALTVVFGKDYKFRLSLEVRSNRPEGRDHSLHGRKGEPSGYALPAFPERRDSFLLG